jgi:phosphoserine phosphatase
MERWATFDCYGTLIDWNGGIGRELERLFGAGKAAPLLHRYHELEPQVQREEPALRYRDVLTLALVRLAESEGVSLRAEEHGALAESLPSWQPFPEARAALEDARARGWKLAILSNTDRDYIDASLERIGVPFELAIVASEIGRTSRRPGTGRRSSNAPVLIPPATYTWARACSTTSSRRARSAFARSGSTGSARSPSPSRTSSCTRSPASALRSTGSSPGSLPPWGFRRRSRGGRRRGRTRPLSRPW